MAILDHTLPLQIKAPNMMRMLDQGSQLAQFYTQQKSDGELARLYKETNGDLNKMMEIGKTSPMARFVMPQLQAQQAAQQKAALDQQKTLSDIGKTQSETLQNNETAQGKKLSNAQTLLTSANQALYVATQSGDANAVKLALNNAKTAGLLDEATYNQYFATAEGLSTNPEGLKSFATNLQLAYSKDPEKYNSPTADNVLDNQTTMRGQDIDKAVADNRLGFDYQKEEVDNQFKYDSLGQDDNQFWASFNQKDAQFYSDQDFQLMKAKIEKQQVKNETPEQKMERVNNVIGSADAARQAARAAVDAAALIKHPGIASGTGLTSFMGMVPSTDAKDFKARLENLKSQVFLPTVKSLQGMGALSNAEGEKIASAVANLDPSIGQEAMAKQLTILAQEMSNSAKKAQKQTQNYATRGGTIQLQTQNRGNNQGGKVYTQAMIQQYASESGRTTQEVAQAVRDSGGTIR